MQASYCNFINIYSGLDGADSWQPVNLSRAPEGAYTLRAVIVYPDGWTCVADSADFAIAGHADNSDAGRTDDEGRTDDGTSIARHSRLGSNGVSYRNGARVLRVSLESHSRPTRHALPAFEHLQA